MSPPPTPQPLPEPARAPNPAERRRWPRARAERPATVAIDGGAHEARVRDISAAGVCFFLDRPLPEMSRVRVQLELPVAGGTRVVSGLGAVVRCERIGMAIEHFEIAVYLQEVAEPDRLTIAEYVRRREN